MRKEGGRGGMGKEMKGDVQEEDREGYSEELLMHSGAFSAAAPCE